MINLPVSTSPFIDISVIFNAFDHNLDGKIGKSEFKRAVKKFCTPYQQFSKKEQKDFVNKTFKEVCTVEGLRSPF